ncbi:LEAF RUST 10 DISEASE-RESISTANCE LOCUS RECEPTOR-LIKE PROTEIN KINASE-like 2.4 [Daucus carota subsp. sativus]|uniref:LEAF RUST 10 DISEASE-RESISTANCE LOCUS RECEPTOR-LIKE PROTEIN KINASE-like 2.4 n=1 Tax=Daucus carota subsp. sativus TaxID=79200 RepID=UPI0007F014B2|nr:PREDICTED: LEAF RUST 10 DISEASE-RESISTANCE LOCUS RECEPTOR-LIKE PROTEIN KINASE-like 2.4 [Daucus carota subsp. sativus]
MCAQLLKPLRYCLNPISFIISFHVLLINFPTCLAQFGHYNYYSDCSNTTAIGCGDTTFKNPLYPFWGESFRPDYCGLDGFELHCENNDLVVDIGSRSKYHVVDFNSATGVLTLNRSDDPLGSICASGEATSTILNATLYDYTDYTEDLSLFYNCADDFDSVWVDYTFTCQSNSKKRVYFFLGNSFDLVEDKLESCTNTTLQVDKTAFEELKSNRIEPEALFKRSFEVHYNRINEGACSDCKATEGLCWRGTNSIDNTCLYSNGTNLPPYGYGRPGKQKNLVLKIVIATTIVCSILLLVILITYSRRRKIVYGLSLFPRYASSFPKDVEAFIRQYGSLIPERFRYSTLTKITDSFKNELGKGGYGNVYKGRLADGRVVAVKVLKEAKGNGEEFINEVASIGRTSHVNIVTLLGFCYEPKRRALIYEYMPNGSLEKFIHGKTPLLKAQRLGWEKLYSIAIGIARGLEYLHRGCSTRILHFDIKPHNILLDKNFSPKISDFGLAKLYNTDESIISSLLQARGTIGYIAPEVTSRNFGKVSHKSDVYSYGMMILEMVGGRKNVNADADQTSEIYYPRWLYKRIKSDDALNLANDISAENEIVRKMVIVGLWCIQIYPSQRPSMSKVIEMLEGRTAALEIPPSPYLCSVPSSPSSSQRELVVCSSSRTERTSSG